MPPRSPASRRIAEITTGFRPGQRVMLSRIGRARLLTGRSNKQQYDLATVICVPSNTTLRVKWDRFKNAQTIAAIYLEDADQALKDLTQDDS